MKLNFRNRIKHSKFGMLITIAYCNGGVAKRKPSPFGPGFFPYLNGIELQSAKQSLGTGGF